MSQGRIWLFLLAAALFFFGAFLTNYDQTLKLKKELEATRNELESLHIEHRDSMDAINNAMLMREAVHERAREIEKRAQEVIADDDLAALPLSDALRMCLQWDDEAAACIEIPAAGDSARGHQDTGQDESENGGRYGSPDN